MSTSPYPHQRPDEPSMSLADWAEDIAVGLALLIAFVIVAAVLALLIVV